MWIQWVCVCVCACTRVCVQVVCAQSVCIPVESWGVFLNHYPRYFWNGAPHWTWSSLVCLDWLTSSKLRHSSNGNANARSTGRPLHASACGTQVLMLVRQALYPLSHLPSSYLNQVFRGDRTTTPLKSEFPMNSLFKSAFLFWFASYQEYVLKAVLARMKTKMQTYKK